MYSNKNIWAATCYTAVALHILHDNLLTYQIDSVSWCGEGVFKRG